MFRRESVPSAEKGKYRGEGGNVEVNISGARRDDNLGRAMAYVRIREGVGVLVEYEFGFRETLRVPPPFAGWQSG